MEFKIYQPGQSLGLWLAIDTETTMVPSHETPDLCTFQVYNGSEAYFVRLQDVRSFFESNPNATFIAHNAPFDIDVICKHLGDPQFFHNILTNNKFYDTMILYTLLHLAEEGFTPKKKSLAFLSEKFLGVKLNKEDGTRLGFAEFKDCEIEEIPDNFKEYALADAKYTYELFKIFREKVLAIGGKNMLTHQIQILGAVALNRIHKNGIGFSQKKKGVFLRKLKKQIKAHEWIINKWGYFRGVAGTQTRYEHIVWLHEQLYGVTLPLTESGKIVADSDHLEQFRNYEFFNSLCEFKTLEKTLSFFEKIETDRVYPRYQTILNTGRTSCANPNIQQLPRAEGVRQLFIPAKGHVFVDVDYSQLELCTLAQTCLNLYGQSTMANLINEGRDLHKYYASILLNKNESDITKEERQYAKASNFGFPGGLGTETFIEYARKSYGIVGLTQNQANKMKDAWFRSFPEMRDYMRSDEGEAWSLTGRKRGNTSYCAEKNTPFQGLAADGAKLALYNITNKNYKIVAFIHDQVVVEVPTNSAKAALEEISDIMIKSMNVVCPDIKIKVEGEIKTEFSK